MKLKDSFEVSRSFKALLFFNKFVLHHFAVFKGKWLIDELYQELSKRHGSRAKYVNKLMVVLLFGSAPLVELSEEVNRNIYQKLLEVHKRGCAWGGARGINTIRENLQIPKHKLVRWQERMPSWFVLCFLQIFSGRVYLRAQPHTQSLFLFPIEFGNNLIHFFNGKRTV